MTASAVPARRGVPRLGRLQTIGLLYGVLGVMLVGYVAPNLEPADKALHVRAAARPGDPLVRSAHDRRRDRASSSCSPRSSACSAPRVRALRPCRACSISTILLAPLVVMLVARLVGSRRHERHPAARRVAAARARRSRSARWPGCGANDRASSTSRIEGMMLAAAGVGFTVYAVLGDAQDTGWLWIGIARRRAHRRSHRRAARARLGELPRRPDHLGRRDQPARARAHQLPALAGDRAARDLDGRQHVGDLDPAALRHPGDRRAALHQQADLLRDVRDRRR